MSKIIGELTFTNRQEWHLVILTYLINESDSSGWGRPQKIKNVKFERLHELEQHGVIEKGIETNTGAAPASIYRMTEKGEHYHEELFSGNLFNPQNPQGIALETLLRFYLIAGDMRDIYPYCLQYLQSDDKLGKQWDNKKTVTSLMKQSGNGYLHTIARLFEYDGIEGVKHLSPDDNVQASWVSSAGEVMRYKAINMKVSQAGETALEMVTARMKVLGFRTHLKGKTAPDGFAAELALIILAAQLDELLPA